MVSVNNNSLLASYPSAPAEVRQPESNIPHHLLDCLKADPTFKNQKKLAKEFKAVSVDQLQPLLEEYFAFLLDQGDKVDPEKAVKKLAEIIPLKKMEKALRSKYPLHRNGLETAKSLLKEAQYYLEISEKKSIPIVVHLRKLLETLITCLESVITAFGVADFFRPLENDNQPLSKAQRIFALVSYYSIMTAALLPLLGAAVAAPIVGSIFLAVSALSFVYPYIKPMPHRLPKSANWSKQIREGKLQIEQVNEKYLDQIANALTSNGRGRMHPMLIGPSGVGKTETAKAFAKAVESGKYPKLKGKQVFYINSADLLNARQDGGNKELQRISEAMGRGNHRNNIILIFDEIHVLSQKRQNVISEQLKTFLDPSHEGFPNVIGITTDQEFDQHISRNNGAFAARFKKIYIASPEDSEVLRILKKTLIQKAPWALIDDQALAYLHQKTKETFPKEAQPSASLKILSMCIKEISESQRSDLETQMDEIHEELEVLNSDNVVGQGNGLLPYNRQNLEQIQDLEDQLADLETQFKKYQKEVQQFHQTREKLKNVKRNGYKNILKISEISQKLKGQDKKLRLQDKKLIKEYLLQSHFLIEAMETHIREKANDLNVKTVIDQSLINKVIDEEKENQEKIAQVNEEDKADQGG